MMKDVIDELVDYIENWVYSDALRTLNNEENILQKYESGWSNKVDKAIRDSIANNHDALYTSVLNECYIAFGLSKKEREEIVSRLKNGEYAK